MLQKSHQKKKRPKDLLHYERKLKNQGFNLIIGVDEACRGPLAGPVVAAAVWLKTPKIKNSIDDSKKLSALAREKAFTEIIRKSIFGIRVIDEKIIDRINILEATRLAMKEAVNSLIKKVNGARTKRIFVLIDGNMSPQLSWSTLPIIKGDCKSQSIASASILAKVIRDRIMLRYDKIYPDYNFKKHKGYPTREHRDILKVIGPSLIHRKSFACV